MNRYVGRAAACLAFACCAAAPVSAQEPAVAASPAAKAKATAVATPQSATLQGNAAAPGCAVERQRRECMADSGNGADLLRCSEAALEGANGELRRVITEITPTVKAAPAVLEALAVANMSWQNWVQRDCETVSAEWQGGSMQAGATKACFYEHTLARAQSLWLRHVRSHEGEIPVECLPGR